MTTNLGYLPVPTTGSDEKEHRRKLAEKINDINRGKFNCTLDVTLSTAATTTVTDPRISQTSVLSWNMALSSAAADFAAGIWCPSSTIVKGAAVLHHAASSVAHPYRIGMWG